MSSIVEAIAKQAQVTFSRAITDEAISEGISKLVGLVKGIRASDLNVSRETTPYDEDTNVSYIDIFENTTFTMGVFVLGSGAQIPLHDHPGMNGILKVIFGTINITSYNRLFKPTPENNLPPDLRARLKGVPRDLLVPVETQLSGDITAQDDPCVVEPNEGNFHEISAVDGPAAFLDILAPPYNTIEKACQYYVPLKSKKTNAEYKNWLLSIPHPEFWVIPIPYKGPKVTV